MAPRSSSFADEGPFLCEKRGDGTCAMVGGKRERTVVRRFNQLYISDNDVLDVLQDGRLKAKASSGKVIAEVRAAMGYGCFEAIRKKTLSHLR